MDSQQQLMSALGGQNKQIMEPYPMIRNNTLSLTNVFGNIASSGSAQNQLGRELTSSSVLAFQRIPDRYSQPYVVSQQWQYPAP